MITKFVTSGLENAQVVVVGVTSGDDWPSTIEFLPEETRKAITRVREVQVKSGLFTGKLGDALELIAPPGINAGRLLVVGLSAKEPLTAQQVRNIGGAAIARVSAARETSATLMIRGPGDCDLSAGEWAANIAFGANLRNYKYMQCRSGYRPKEAILVEEILVEVEDSKAAEALYEPFAARVEAVHLARDLTNEPPNSLNPDSFAERALGYRQRGVEVEVLDKEQLQEYGMNAIIAVGAASDSKPRLLVMRWKGNPDSNENDIGLVGKGVTFDSGGLNLKQGDFMRGMKGDMAGGAAVFGAIQAAADSKVRANVVGVIPLVENSISGSAYRPSDVIKTARGDSVEVLDTDAEGRMILIDALWYANTHVKAKQLVSIGTLGGSALLGLGLKYGCLYTDDETVASGFIAAGKASGDQLWRMPADEDLDDDLKKSSIADYLQQTDMFTYGADSAYIARLLSGSAGETPWAHIEMCRLEWAISDRPTCPEGATGYGVQLFTQYIDDCVLGKPA